MTRGSPAELAVRENFGKVSASPRGAGKTRLRGLQYSHRRRWADVLPADQPDTWAQGLLAQAQRVTPNGGTVLLWRRILNQGTGAPREPLSEAGEAQKGGGDKRTCPHPDNPAEPLVQPRTA